MYHETGLLVVNDSRLSIKGGGDGREYWPSSKWRENSGVYV